MKFKCFVLAASVAFVIVPTAVNADTGITVKWPEDVGETIRLISVDIDSSAGGNFHTASFTYEALKTCRNLSVFGHTYTKDDIQQGKFSLGTKMDVNAGQKFKDQAVLTMDPGGYIVVDKAYCL